MGSTSTYRAAGQTDDEYFYYSNGEAPFRARHELLASASKRIPNAGGYDWNGVYYAALRDRKTGQVWCLVILMHRNNFAGDNYNFSYKEMDESMGPAESTCPDKILDLLSPTDDVYANAWRDRCRAHNLRERVAPKAGAHIRLVTPLSFSDGVERALFRVGSRNRLQSLSDGTWVRLPNWKHYAYELVSN